MIDKLGDMQELKDSYAGATLPPGATLPSGVTPPPGVISSPGVNLSSTEPGGSPSAVGVDMNYGSSGVNVLYGSSTQKVEIDTWSMLLQQARVFELSYIASVMPTGPSPATGTAAGTTTAAAAAAAAASTRTTYDTHSATTTNYDYHGHYGHPGHYSDLSAAELDVPPATTRRSGGGGGRRGGGGVIEGERRGGRSEGVRGEADGLFEKLASHITGPNQQKLSFTSSLTHPHPLSNTPSPTLPLPH